MKTLILTAFTLALSSAAHASPSGSYAFEHDVAFGGGYTRGSCNREGGRWKRDACVFRGTDTVQIIAGEESLTLEVNTIRTNGRDCAFKGDAKIVSSTELLASAPSGDAVCELKVSFLDENTLKVEKLDAANCSELCGTSMIGLDVPRAVRQSTVR